MKNGIAISLAGHVIILIWALITFVWPHPLRPTDSMPVDVISTDEFSKMTAGAKNAPKVDAPKPVVEKIGEEKPVEDPTAKVVEKKPVVLAAAETPPAPEPQIKPPEPKPAAAPPQQKTESKTPEKKEPEKKIDPIAEALKKDEAKKPDKKAESKPEPVQKPVPQQPKFDPRQTAALLNKLDPQRTAATGASLNTTASLGAPAGSAMRLSQSEMDAFKARLMSYWNLPAGARNPDELLVEVRIQLGPDGRLVGTPQVLNSGSGVLFQAARDSALRAIYRGQPFDMLRPDHYELWREIDVRFDPRELQRG